MLFKQKTCLLQGWINLFLHLQKSANNTPDVSYVVSVLLLVKLKLIIEQVVLLLENSDAGQAVRKILQCVLEEVVERSGKARACVVLNDSPEVRLWLDVSLYLHYEFQDVYTFISGLVQSLDSEK